MHNIRLATPADRAVMERLINAAFAVETFIEGTRTDSGHLAAMMQQGIFLLAFDPSGELVGSVYVEIRGTRGYFGMLSVSPARQGTGIGRILVKAAEDYCRERGCGVMDISVLSLRPELPPLYRKFGYTETCKEEFHPRNPLKPGLECHSIVMSKPL